MVLCLFSNFAGALYPVYATFRALEEKQAPVKEHSVNEIQIWSCYWAVYGSVKALESIIDPVLSKQELIMNQSS